EKWLAKNLLSSYPKDGDYGVGGEGSRRERGSGGMKRAIVLALCLVGLIAGPVAALPFLVSTGLSKRRIAAEIPHPAGRGVSFSGEPLVSFFPSINVQLDNVSLANPEGMDGAQPFITMDAVVGRVRILPLFVGRTEIDDFQLIHPRL